MAANDCDLSHLTSEDDGCVEQLSGTGTMAYFFNAHDLLVTPERDEDDPAYYASTSFDKSAFKEGKGCYKVELRNDANNIQTASVATKKGFIQTGTLVTDILSSVASRFMRRLNNINHKGCLIETGTGEYYVIFNPQKKNTIEIAGDTGTASSDESGFTATINQWSTYPYDKYKGAVAIAGETETP